VCLTKVNKKPDSADRVVAVIPLVQADSLNPEYHSLSCTCPPSPLTHSPAQTRHSTQRPVACTARSILSTPSNDAPRTSIPQRLAPLFHRDLGPQVCRLRRQSAADRMEWTERMRFPGRSATRRWRRRRRKEQGACGEWCWFFLRRVSVFAMQGHLISFHVGCSWHSPRTLA
jgi:hypothetical protein